MKLLLIIIGGFCSVSLAQAAEGLVIDLLGQPIAGATVDIVGSNKQLMANTDGLVLLPTQHGHALELHIKAPGYMHKVFHLPAEVPTKLTFQLTPTVIEVVNVIGLPWHASNVESAQPVSVLGDEELRRRQASTLGDTLKGQVGVHSSYYGPVASSPIIRGLEGPRVLISQNGLDVGDASRVGPDHAVATEASTARQIEILRGPATLFYGSGAIGGVVNIVDDRVPQSNDTEGEWRVEHNSVAADKLVSGSLTTGTGNLAFHVDGFWRDAGDYKIPYAEHAIDDHDHDHDHDHESKTEQNNRRLANSAAEGKGFNLGASYLLESGFVGLSVGRLERRYGIPGHSHGEQAISVEADVVQDRLQLLSELNVENTIISAINTRVGYTDYRHDEIEAAVIGTTFTNKSYEARTDIFHHPVADWRGAFTLHYKRNDFSAIGLEAFTPPNVTESWALAVIEERHFGDVLIQLGARTERVEVTAQRLTDAMENSDGSSLRVDDFTHVFNPFSISAGSVWNFTEGYNFAASYTHAQRAPSASELLSYGPHLGSGLFELGALFKVNALTEGGYAIELNQDSMQLEKSSNIDISLRKVNGNVGFISTFFYNKIDHYYYLTDSGQAQEINHSHDDHSHSESLPLFVYQAQDVSLYGFESELTWQYKAPLKVTLMTDYIRAQLKKGGDLPRIPPLRIGGRINYLLNNVDIEFSASHYFKQQRVAALETHTDGYTLIDMQVSYPLDNWLPHTSFYLKGQNLTNEYAQVHSSFLKDLAPLPARAFAVGLSGKF